MLNKPPYLNVSGVSSFALKYERAKVSFAVYCKTILVRKEPIAHQRACVVQRAPFSSVKNGCPGWDRTSDKVVNSHLLYR